LGGRWGRVQKVVAYSDVIPSMLNLFSSFTDDKMVLQAISAHDKFIIILLQYIMFLFWRDYLPNKQKSSDFSPFSFPKTIVFIPSGAKAQKKEIIPYPRCGFGACLRCGRAS